MSDLEQRIQNIEQYLPQSAEIVLNLTMRTAALERFLVKKGFSQEEIQKEVEACYAELMERKEMEGLLEREEL